MYAKCRLIVCMKMLTVSFALDETVRVVHDCLRGIKVALEEEPHAGAVGTI